MQRISRAQFVERFPMTVPAWKLNGIEGGPLRLDSEAHVSGILNGGLTVAAGSKALVHGIVDGPVVVETDAVLYFDGIVERRRPGRRSGVHRRNRRGIDREQ
jgi:hypothetical protein